MEFGDWDPTTKGMTEGKANSCGECGQTFDNRLEGSLTVRLRQLSRDVEDKINILLRVDRKKTPPAVEYTLVPQLPLHLTRY